jgi:hypothetical protein
MRQVAYLCAFLARGLALSYEDGQKNEVQGVLPEAARGKAYWLYGKEREEKHRGICKTDHLPGLRAGFAKNAVPSEFIKRSI